MSYQNETNRLKARAGLAYANAQDALATAYAKATNQDKEKVLEELRALERRRRDER